MTRYIKARNLELVFEFVRGEDSGKSSYWGGAATALLVAKIAFVDLPQSRMPLLA